MQKVFFYFPSVFLRDCHKATMHSRMVILIITEGKRTTDMYVKTLSRMYCPKDGKG